MRGVINLDISATDDMSCRTIIFYRVAPHLALGREQIGIACQMVQIARLIVATSVSEEILVLVVPDVRITEILCILCFGVEYYRVTHHLIYLIAHLDIVHSDKVVSRGVVVATFRLHKTLALEYIATAEKLAHLGIGVERTVVGIHHRIAIYNLDQIGVYPRLARIVTILRLVAIDIRSILIYKYIAIALETLIREAHSTVCRDYCTIVMCSEVTHEDKNSRITVVDKVGVIRNHIHHTAIVILLARRCCEHRLGRGIQIVVGYASASTIE